MLQADPPDVTYPRYLPLPGVPAELDLFPPDLLEEVNAQLVAEAIGNREAREAAEREQAARDEEERALSQELQGDLFKADEYKPPPLEDLRGRRPGSSKRRNIGGVPRELVELEDRELALRVWWIFKHRRQSDGRGLREHDRHLQREWLNRAGGYALIRTLATEGNLGLPAKYLPLANKRRRSPARESIVRLLMLLDAWGWNGFYLSSREAVESGLVGSEATWWRAMAQLRAWGVVVYLRTWKPGFFGRNADRDRNWYGIGPRMALERAAYLAELGQGGSAEELERLNLEAERRRARKAARRRGPRRDVNVLAELPRWHVVLVGRLSEEARARARFRYECERADAVRNGAPLLEEEPAGAYFEVPPPMDVEEERAVEEAVRATLSLAGEPCSAARLVAEPERCASSGGKRPGGDTSSDDRPSKALSCCESPSGTPEFEKQGSDARRSAELVSPPGPLPPDDAQAPPDTRAAGATKATHRATRSPLEHARAQAQPGRLHQVADSVPTEKREPQPDPDAELDPAELETLREIRANPPSWDRVGRALDELTDCPACYGLGLPALGGCPVCGS